MDRLRGRKRTNLLLLLGWIGERRGNRLGHLVRSRTDMSYVPLYAKSGLCAEPELVPDKKSKDIDYRGGNHGGRDETVENQVHRKRRGEDWCEIQKEDQINQRQNQGHY